MILITRGMMLGPYLTTVLILLLVATTISAQSTRGVTFHAAGSAVVAIGQVGDRARTGFGASVGVGFVPSSLSRSNVEFIVRGNYDKLGSSFDNGADFRFAGGGLDIRLFPTTTKPSNLYFLAGAGYGAVEWGEIETDGANQASISESGPYASAGIGMEFGNRFPKAFFQGRLVYLSGSEIPDYRFFRFSLGIRL